MAPVSFCITSVGLKPFWLFLGFLGKEKVLAVQAFGFTENELEYLGIFAALFMRLSGAMQDIRITRLRHSATLTVFLRHCMN